MSDQDVFEDTATQQNNNNVATSEDNPYATLLSSITREDGTPKYDSVEKALDALKHSQTHIRSLEQEKEQLRAREEELSRRANQADVLEEIVNRLNGKTDNNAEGNPPVGGNAKSGEATTTDLEKIVKAQLDARDAETKAMTNLNYVNTQIKNKFGDKSHEVVKQKAEELDISIAEFKTLAAKSPQLVLGHFSITSTPPKPTNSSSISTNSLRPQEEKLTRPEKSVLSGSGANTSNLVDHWRQIKEVVARKNGIET